MDAARKTNIACTVRSLKLGRPTVYSSATVKEARAYVENYIDHGDVMPTVAGLARVLGISRDTVYAWARDADKKDFSDTLDQLKAEQERCLLNNALVGRFSPTIARLVLRTNHGYVERIERVGLPEATVGVTIDAKMDPSEARRLTVVVLFGKEARRSQHDAVQAMLSVKQVAEFLGR